MTGKGEQEFMKLPLDKQTKNAPLLCRNLHLEVDGSWEKVENFTPFTAKDMAEMRKHILSMDPIFKGESHITNPTTGEERTYPIVWAPNFYHQSRDSLRLFRLFTSSVPNKENIQGNGRAIL